MISLLALGAGRPVHGEALTQSDTIVEELTRGVVIVKALRANRSYQMGTGFVISSDGMIATNFHVIVEAERFEIQTKDGKVYPVEVIANYDDASDLFVLKAQTNELSALVLGDSDQLSSGEEVFAIGHTQTQEYQLYHGKYLGPKEGAGHLLELEIPSVLGNSGGPIFNERNEVIGMLVQGRLDVEGLGYGIPINEAKGFFNYNKVMTPGAFIEGLSEAFKLTYLGDGELMSRKYEAAIEHYRQALSFDKSYLEAHIGLARAYAELENIPQAVKEWQEVLAQDPEDLEASLYMGKYYFSRGNYRKAIAYMEKATAQAPQSVHVYNDLGLANGELGNLEKAIEYYKKAVAVDPQYATGYFNLSAAYYNKKDLKSAKEYCQLALKHGYDVPASFLSLLGIKY